jgi:ABC-type polysaccharide/polyol phosphate transport system ATPase subunit
VASDVILDLNSVSKAFCRDPKLALRYGLYDIVREIVPLKRGPVGLRRGEFWAIEDVTFSLKAGEAVAIMGRNGAGKTSLLRMIAGLLKPDRGKIAINGSVNSVIELGHGLDPLLTGVENAELGLAWRGISAPQIKALIPEIASFTELNEMFESPVQNYSAGMKVRLAFGIASFVPCNLLLLDEVLAVGDVAFQQKCLRHIQSHLHKGGSVILVSHDVIQMQNICRRGILMDQGRLFYSGAIEACVEKMFDIQDPKSHCDDDGDPASGTIGNSKGDLFITRVLISSACTSEKIGSGDDVSISISFFSKYERKVVFATSILTRDLGTCVTNLVDPEVATLQEGSGHRRCRIPNLPLSPGTYCLRTVILDPETYHPISHVGIETKPTLFRVFGDGSLVSLMSQDQGQLVVMDQKWS